MPPVRFDQAGPAPAVLVCCLTSSDPQSLSGLEAVARACAPRVALFDRAVVFDVSGCERIIGPPDVVLREVAALAAARGLTTRAAIAPAVTTAWLLAHAGVGASLARAGGEAAVLAPLPLRCLEALPDLDRPQGTSGRSRQARGASLLLQMYRDHLAILERWGLKTMGSLAALPRRDVHARLGPLGVHLHQAASGEETQHFVPIDEPQPFQECMTLEWPVDGLEPLAFILARLCERLSTRLDRADRGAVAIRTRLRLVSREPHERLLHLPAPIADPRVLRTLILLDLESHPPPAAIDIVDLHLDVSPGRIVQGSLLAASLPTPEDLTTLLARLGALMGESRVGAAALVDTHDPRRVEMAPFHVPGPREGTGPQTTARRNEADPGRGTPESRPSQLYLRRLRLPIAAHVVLDGGMPIVVRPSARGLEGGRVVMRAGPWRTSGGWWTFGRASWDRDEWDLQLEHGAIYRVVRDRQREIWEIEGVLD